LKPYDARKNKRSRRNRSAYGPKLKPPPPPRRLEARKRLTSTMKIATRILWRMFKAQAPPLLKMPVRVQLPLQQLPKVDLVFSPPSEAVSSTLPVWTSISTTSKHYQRNSGKKLSCSNTPLGAKKLENKELNPTRLIQTSSTRSQKKYEKRSGNRRLMHNDDESVRKLADKLQLTVVRRHSQKRWTTIISWLLSTLPSDVSSWQSNHQRFCVNWILAMLQRDGRMLDACISTSEAIETLTMTDPTKTQPAVTANDKSFRWLTNQGLPLCFDSCSFLREDHYAPTWDTFFATSVVIGSHDQKSSIYFSLSSKKAQPM
jgi:hypothetical protein